MTTVDIRNPQGTRDFNPHDTRIRKYIIDKITTIFKRYGGEQIDTPVIERLEIVKNIYGEEFDKLVYELDDQGDKLFLRYDLTVPCVRFIANNGLKLFKRYQVGKVYRRDHPQIAKGRYREFYQADFDIIGEDYGQMVQEIEMISLLDNIMKELINDSYTIKINHRQILFNMIIANGFEEKDINTVCSSIDKMDKLTKEEIMNELVNDKGFTEDSVSSLLQMISDCNNTKNHTIVDKLNNLKQNKIIDSILYDSLYILFTNIDNSRIIFDISLARGLDYYTGIVYEVCCNKRLIASSIAAGGRYDSLIEKMSNKGKIPAIGLSIGIERLVIVIKKLKMYQDKPDVPSVFVASVGDDLTVHRIKLCLRLRNAGIHTETVYLKKPKMRSQFKHVFNNNIPYMLVIGEDEIKNNKVRVKIISENKQYDVSNNDIVEHIQNLCSLCYQVGDK